MNFYREAKKLYSQGQYTQTLALLENHQHENSDFERLKKSYALALSSAVELKNYQKFKVFFHQMKNHLLDQHGITGWVECLKYLFLNKKLPEFFIREELIATYQDLGKIKELEEECQNQMDRSVKRRRININVMAYQDFLGKHVEVYHILHKIYWGKYEEAGHELKKFKSQFVAEKFQKIIHFIAANIGPAECKRIEVKEVIISHLAKKRNLETSYYNREDIASFEKVMIQNFINLLILDFKNKDHIIDLIEFVTQTGNTRLEKDLFECLKKFPGVKENERFKKLQQFCSMKDSRPREEDGGLTSKSQDREDRKALSTDYSLERTRQHHWSVMSGKAEGWNLMDFKRPETSIKDLWEEESMSPALEALMQVYTQTDEWFLERFEKIMIGLIELNFYGLALESVERIKKINDGRINAIDIDYFEGEIHLLKKDYINAIRVCHDVLNQKNLNVNDEICFEYLKGEAYFSSGDKVKAYKSFKKVFNVNPSYRLARERLKVLEKNK